MLVVYTDPAGLASALKRLSIPFRVPRSPEDLLCKEPWEVLFVEKDLADILPEQPGCRTVFIDTGAGAEEAVLKALEASKGPIGELVVGIDPGACHAYVVVADSLLVGYRYECSVDGLVDRVCRIMGSVEAGAKKVKVGERGGVEIARLIARRCGEEVEVLVVGEELSTRGQPAPSLVGLPRRLGRDFAAAARIAVREGYSVEG